MTIAAVHYEQRGDLGIIKINNPPVNALSQPVRAGLIEALQQSANDVSKLVLLMCEGSTFIAGADISEFGKPPMAPSLPEVILALENHDKPVLSVLHGNTLGGGLEVAMATHYRCGVDTTRVGLPEVKLGLLPGSGGTQRLPRLVGVGPALDMILGGNTIPAARAAELGLIDHILEGEPEAAARAYAAQLIAENAGPRPTGARVINETLPVTYFSDYRAGVARKTRGLIAPGYIVDLVEAATQLSIDEGQALERYRFIECRESPQSIALRYVFFAQRAASKIADLPRDISVRPVTRVAVIGAGTMGGGIAMNFVQAGIPITLVESNPVALKRGLNLIKNNYDTSIKRKRFSAEQVTGFMTLITGSTDYGDLAKVDIVIEAVFEDLAVKQEVFQKLDAICKPDCILATNTSYLDINDIAAFTERPGQVVGAHFFSPANVMKLLEVVRGARTAPDVIATFMQLAKRVNKIPVLVGACHGFVGNRMLKRYARQAQLLLLEGASPTQVDSVIEDWGMAMGPLAVGDLAGLDIGYRSRRGQGIASKSQLESALPDTLMDMGRLGQKSGSGYYIYAPGSRRGTPDSSVDTFISDIAGQWQVSRRTLDNEEIIDRLILALINEGAAILEEGIATRPSDIDTIYINGYGFPAWRGGPMFYADQLGLDAVLAKLRALQAATGDACWQAAPLLERLVSKGEQFDSLN